MFPIFEPVTVMFQPVAVGILSLAAVAVAGTLAIAGLVLLAGGRGIRLRGTSARRDTPARRLPEAA